MSTLVSSKKCVGEFANRVNVVYIAGHNRSGTTLLGAVLSQISGAVFVGELRHLWKRGVIDNHLCGCGETFRECPFWCDVLKCGFGGISPTEAERYLTLQRQVDRMRYVPWMLASELIPSYGRRFAEYSEVMYTLYSAIREVSGVRFVIDSSKIPSSLFALSKMTWVDLFPIHIVRDSRGVAYSRTKTKRRVEIPNRETYMKTYRPLQSAISWTGLNLLIEISKRFSTNYLRVTYEDFIKYPAEQIRAILAMVGIADQTLPFLQEQLVSFGELQHTVSGNPGLFAAREIELRVDDRWKEELDLFDRLLVSMITGPLLRRYYR